MNNKHIITTIVVAIIVGVIGFFGGMQYGKAAVKPVASGAGQFAGTGAPGAGNFAGRRGGAGGAGGAGFVTGQVLSKDSSSITVKLPGTAGTKIVFYSGSTQISKPQPIAVDQLNVGDNVIVTGTAGSDGSETAQTIQVRPPMPSPSGMPSPTQAGQ